MSDPTPQDTTTATLLKTLVASDPDYATFAKQHPELSHLTLPKTTELDLARDTLTLLEQLPDRSTPLQRLKSADTRQAYDAGIASIPILLAAAFLLRTHLHFKRSRDGKWEFTLEHKPADTALVKQLLTKIAQLLSLNRIG